MKKPDEKNDKVMSLIENGLNDIASEFGKHREEPSRPAYMSAPLPAHGAKSSAKAETELLPTSLQRAIYTRKVLLVAMLVVALLTPLDIYLIAHRTPTPFLTAGTLALEQCTQKVIELIA